MSESCRTCKKVRPLLNSFLEKLSGIVARVCFVYVKKRHTSEQGPAPLLAISDEKSQGTLPSASGPLSPGTYPQAVGRGAEKTERGPWRSGHKNGAEIAERGARSGPQARVERYQEPCF